jgi:hypothetical protein
MVAYHLLKREYSQKRLDDIMLDAKKNKVNLSMSDIYSVLNG